jgi:group I intron endonuclease
MALKSSTLRCGVYVIENTANGKVYIGSSSEIPARWARHRARLRDGIHENQHLQRAWVKYGADAFVFCVAHETTPADRRAVEAETLRAYGVERAYNAMPPSSERPAMTHSAATRAKISAGNVGRSCSPETRERISAKHRGKVLTPEHRQKLSDAKRGRPKPADHPVHGNTTWRGRQHTPETLAKMRATKLGHPVSAETRAKLSQALKGRSLKPVHRAKVVAATAERRRVQREGANGAAS